MPILADDVNFIRDIKLFVNAAPKSYAKSAWVGGEWINVYLRNGPRYISGEQCQTITVANITTTPPRSGLYNDFLKLIESISTDIVFIENVLDRSQNSIYLNRGYTLIDPINNCFIKYVGYRHYTEQLDLFYSM